MPAAGYSREWYDYMWVETPVLEKNQGLKGKTILVTGAAKRIGRGIALRLAQEGARVAIHYDRSEAEARRTAAECGGAELFRANLESVQQIQRMFGEVELPCWTLRKSGEPG